MIGEWHRTSSSPGNDFSPELLISKKRNDDSRKSEREPCGRRTGASMVDDTRNLSKEPVVWNASNDENVFRHVYIIHSKVTPTFRNDRSLAGILDRFEYDFRQLHLVVDDNGSKSNVDRLWSCFEKFIDFARGLIIRLGRKEAKSTDVDVVTPVLGFRKDCWGPAKMVRSGEIGRGGSVKYTRDMNRVSPTGVLNSAP